MRHHRYLAKRDNRLHWYSAFNMNHHKILKRCEEITRYRIFFVYLQYLKTNQSIT